MFLESKQKLFLCFVDFKKAFDRVNWCVLMQILRDIGVDWWDKRLLANLHLGQPVSVRTLAGNTGPAEAGKCSPRLSGFSNFIQHLCGSYGEGSCGKDKRWCSDWWTANNLPETC